MIQYSKNIDEWFRLIETGKIKVCKWQLLLVDYIKQKFRDQKIIVEQKRSDEAIEFIETHMEIELIPWEKYVCDCIYGLYNEDSTLVFNKHFFLLGRGAGKNKFMAGMALYESSKKHGIKNYDIDFVAPGEDQARISFDDIHDLLEASKKRKGILARSYYFTKEIIKNLSTLSKIKFNTSNPKTKDGKRDGHVFFDEVHIFENYKQIKVFTSGVGKVKWGRISYFTTQGDVRGGVLDDLLNMSKNILEGKSKNPKFFPFLCMLDNEEEIEDPSNWEKANPSINYFPFLKQQMIDEYTEALLIPSQMEEFKTKRMNIPSENIGTAVTSWEQILKTNQPIPDLIGMNCVGGIDYSDIRDFCSVGLLFKKNGKKIWIHHSFICKNSPYLKLIHFDYKVAVQKGLATLTEGNTINPQYVVDWFLRQMKLYRVLKIAADSFRFRVLKEAFQKEGIYDETKERPDGLIKLVRNGSYTHNLVAPTIDESFANERYVFGDDLLMRWFVNNTYTKIDGHGNKTYCKIEPLSRKNDGFMALVHAESIEDIIPNEISEYIEIPNITW